MMPQVGIITADDEATVWRVKRARQFVKLIIGRCTVCNREYRPRTFCNLYGKSMRRFELSLRIM